MVVEHFGTQWNSLGTLLEHIIKPKLLITSI